MRVHIIADSVQSAGIDHDDRDSRAAKRYVADSFVDRQVLEGERSDGHLNGSTAKERATIAAGDRTVSAHGPLSNISAVGIDWHERQARPPGLPKPKNLQ